MVHREVIKWEVKLCTQLQVRVLNSCSLSCEIRSAPFICWQFPHSSLQVFSPLVWTCSPSSDRNDSESEPNFRLVKTFSRHVLARGAVICPASLSSINSSNSHGGLENSTDAVCWPRQSSSRSLHLSDCDFCFPCRVGKGLAVHLRRPTRSVLVIYDSASIFHLPLCPLGGQKISDCLDKHLLC